MRINTIYNQLPTFSSRHQFENAVSRHQGDRYVKHFSCWRQFITMLYAQARGKKSLRDIETGLKVHQPKWYHIGLKSIAMSTLPHANKNRSYEIYENMFYLFLKKCKSITPKHKFRFKNPLHSLDSTVIDLCLELFPWAKFRKAKGAIKIHSLLDHQGHIPSFLVVTPVGEHDIKVATSLDLPILPDSILTFDKAYIDFKWLKTLDSNGIYWVSRAKRNMDYRVIGQQKKNIQRGIHSDKSIKLKGVCTSKKYPNSMRLIHYYDREAKKHYYFLMNNFKLAAHTIAKIYKARWDVEIFFKWIKQNLKIKTFLGTSKNAVLTQVWIAMIYYLLLAYIKYQTKYKHSLLTFTRIIGETLFDRVNLIDLLSLNVQNLKKIRDPTQLGFLF